MEVEQSIIQCLIPPRISIPVSCVRPLSPDLTMSWLKTDYTCGKDDNPFLRRHRQDWRLITLVTIQLCQERTKTVECRNRFPLDTIFDIKEPYYKISNSDRLPL